MVIKNFDIYVLAMTNAVAPTVPSVEQILQHLHNVLTALEEIINQIDRYLY